jgi:DNA-binding transcriptional regulator YiaG
MTDTQMTPDELEEARQKLGLSVAQMAAMLDTDPQTWRRMTMAPDRSTHRKPPPRLVRLLQAYLAGFKPYDWPAG